MHDVRLVAVLGEYVRQRLRQAHVVFNDETCMATCFLSRVLASIVPSDLKSV